MMLKTIEEVRGTRKRSVDEFVKRLYQEEQYRKYRKVDTVFFCLIFVHLSKQVGSCSVLAVPFQVEGGSSTADLA